MANTSRGVRPTGPVQIGGGKTHGAWARRKTLGGPAGAASPGTQAEAQTRRKAENMLAAHLPCRLRSLVSPLAIPDDFPVAQLACKSNTQLAGRLIPPQTGHLPERGELSEELTKVHIKSANEAISKHTHCLGEGRGLRFRRHSGFRKQDAQTWLWAELWSLLCPSQPWDSGMSVLPACHRVL